MPEQTIAPGIWFDVHGTDLQIRVDGVGHNQLLTVEALRADDGSVAVQVTWAMGGGQTAAVRVPATGYEVVTSLDGSPSYIEPLAAPVSPEEFMRGGRDG